MDLNVGYILSKCVLGIGSYHNKEKIALIFKDKSYTYEELNKKANKIANSLIELGLKKGERIAVLAKNCEEWVFSFFGAAKSGGIIVPVNIYLKPPEIEYIVKDSEVSYFIVDEEFIPRVESIRGNLKGIREFISLGEAAIPNYLQFKKLENGGAEEPPVEVGLKDALTIAYTSGTTGEPKGVVITHGNRIWGVFANIDAYGITRRDVYLCLPSLSWAAGFQHNFLATMYQGGTVILMPSGAMHLEKVVKMIERHCVTMAFVVPTLIKQWVDRPELKKYDISSFRVLSTGSEMLGSSLVHRFHELYPKLPICQAYGLTEGPMFALVLKKEYALEKADRTGKPGLNTIVRLVNEKGRDVSVGEQGEIILRSPEVMREYWKKPEATQETLRDGWLHTGDLGTKDKDGFVAITGRKKDMIISGGLNIYPAEIENVIYRHDKVAEVAVIGIPDSKWGEVAKATVRVKANKVLTKEELIDLCKQELATYKIPKQFDFVKYKLPRNASGKLQKWKLK